MKRQRKTVYLDKDGKFLHDAKRGDPRIAAIARLVTVEDSQTPIEQAGWIIHQQVLAPLWRHRRKLKPVCL